MAITVNPDRPNGFAPVGYLYGGSFGTNLRVMRADGAGSDIFRQDLVNLMADGAIDQYDAADTGAFGVFMGMTDVTLRSTAIGEHPGYYDASAAGANSNLLVLYGNGLLGEMQEDGDTDPLELADIGQNVETIHAGGADGANTTTGISDMEIDSSSHNTTATLPLQLVRLVDRPDNQLGDTDTTIPNARWIVLFNPQVFASAGNAGL